MGIQSAALGLIVVARLHLAPCGHVCKLAYTLCSPKILELIFLKIEDT